MNELGNTHADKNYKSSGISRAEELASRAAYAWQSDKDGNLTLEMFPDAFYRGFLKGYEQAEEDLALTWEDIKTIEQIIATSDWYDFEINGKLWSKEFYEEVLKRLKEVKK